MRTAKRSRLSKSITPARSNSKEAAVTWQASQSALRRGPYAFAFVRRGVHHSSLLWSRGYALARSFVASCLIAVLLSWTAGLGYLRRWLFCMLAGVFAGLVAEVPLMIWFEAPLDYTVTCIVDHLCEWSLAGLPLAAFVPGRGAGSSARPAA